MPVTKATRGELGGISKATRGELGGNSKATRDSLSLLTVILHIDAKGDPCVYVDGPAHVYWIDESAPQDRIFKATKAVQPERIKDLIAGPPKP